MGAKLTEMTLLSELAQSSEAPPYEVQADLRKIARQARELTGTLSETVWAVNPRNDTLDSFVTYACNYAVDYLKLGGVRCRLEIPGSLPARLLTSQARHHLLLVCKEALSNVVKHAAASEVLVRVVLRPGGFALTIQDNGKGFSPENPEPEAGNEAARATRRHPQGNGLFNMRQRVEDIGGRFELWSQPAQGTRIEVELDFHEE
jgi:signal transduction histidine kinase